MDFATMMTLEPHGPDTYVGIGPKYPWGGLYGGQIVAQALRAAAATVDAAFRVHSLHAYFIRRGDHEEPIRFEVDRIRNGRSFTTRLVVARQAVGAILNMSASFQVDEPGPDAQTAEMPDVTPPEELAGVSSFGMFERRLVPTGGERGRALGWLRMTDGVGDDPALHACALAYMSDDLPTDAVVAVQYPALRRSVGARVAVERVARSRHLVPPTRACGRMAAAGVHVPRSDQLTRPVGRPRLRPIRHPSRHDQPRSPAAFATPGRLTTAWVPQRPGV